MLAATESSLHSPNYLHNIDFLPIHMVREAVFEVGNGKYRDSKLVKVLRTSDCEFPTVDGSSVSTAPPKTQGTC